MRTIDKIEECVKTIHDAYTILDNPNVKVIQVNIAWTTIKEETENLERFLVLYNAEQVLKTSKPAIITKDSSKEKGNVRPKQAKPKGPKSGGAKGVRTPTDSGS